LNQDIDAWGNISIVTYVQLQEKVNQNDVDAKIETVIKDNLDGLNIRTYLQPVTSIHLYSTGIIGMGGTGDIKYVYIFSIIAAFILLIACINFMNLSTAKSSQKAREVGMRKVVGATKSNLVLQYLGESFSLTVIALVFALILVFAALPVVNDLLEKDLKLNLTGNINLIIGLLSITFITGLVSGSYPALFLSSYHPAKVLRGTFLRSIKGGSPVLRRILVVVQFSLSIILIICTLIVADQQSYIKNRNLGFDKDNVLFFRMRGNMNQQYNSIKAELLKNPNIINAASSSIVPTNLRNVSVGFEWEGKETEEPARMNVMRVDHDYFNTFNMEFAEGQSFSKEFTTDTANCIVNEAAVKFMGIGNPVGKSFSFGGRNGKIIGVLKDFHFATLHEAIEPLVVLLETEGLNFVSLKIRSDQKDLTETISYIKDVWNRFSSGYPFIHNFLDESIDRLYSAESRVGRIFNYFTFLAIFISCLGLFGLAAFSAEQRTKEIGIRKVLGASLANIIGLLSREFFILVILSNIIAWPVSYYFMNKWLQNFAYHVEIGYILFLGAAFLAIVIALITVSYQAIRAALADPVNSLRNE
jgi:putative ABC transport system permease protein